MAEGSALTLCRGHATICLPIGEEQYDAIVENPKEFRQWLDRCFADMPELFPVDFAQGYRMKDGRDSLKQGVSLRRVVLRNGKSYSIRPSFLMPYMTARTQEVEDALFLRKFGVPFWALARVFGGDPMGWYRLEDSVSAGRHPAVFLACVAEDPRPGETPRGRVLRSFQKSLEHLSRSRPPELFAAHSQLTKLGKRMPEGNRAREGLGPL